jgi:hypothetical protein
MRNPPAIIAEKCMPLSQLSQTGDCIDYGSMSAKAIYQQNLGPKWMRAIIVLW